MDITLEAFKREKSIKAKRLLKEGMVPACLYGKGIETMELIVPQQKMNKVFEKHPSKIDLVVEGKTWLVGISEIQREAVTRKPCHISFHNLDKSQKSVFEVKVCLTGKPKEGMVAHLLHTIEVKGRPDQIPDQLEMDISGLGLGEALRISDLSLKGSFEIVTPSSDVIAKCRHLQALEEPAEEKPAEATVEKEAPSAEPEVEEKLAS